MTSDRTNPVAGRALWRAVGFGGVFGKIFEIVDTDVLGRNTERPVSIPQIRIDLEVRRVNPGTSGWAKLVPEDRHRTVRGFFARGDVGWIARVDNHFGGWIWLSRLSHRDPWSGFRIRLAPDEAYAYGLWVKPELRPAGVAAVLMAWMLREAHEDPALGRVYGWVDSRNRKSQALMRMSGFQSVQHVKRLHVLRRFGAQLPLSDRPAFGPLSRAGMHEKGTRCQLLLDTGARQSGDTQVRAAPCKPERPADDQTPGRVHSNG